ncbi:hypothetical protein BpHYR1_040858, partial [Brachionus plicatilis]
MISQGCPEARPHTTYRIETSCRYLVFIVV